jgi:hypothetical protein
MHYSEHYTTIILHCIETCDSAGEFRQDSRPAASNCATFKAVAAMAAASSPVEQGPAHDFLTASFSAAGGLPWPAPHLRQDTMRGRDGTSCCVLLTPHRPPAVGSDSDPTSAAAVATARAYRALSTSGTPDAVILLYPRRSGAAARLDGAQSWATPLGTVHAAADLRAALTTGAIEAGDPEAEFPALHAPWLWFIAAQYDCERRDNLVIPQLTGVGVDDTALTGTATAALTQALCAAVRAATPRRRVAILASVDVVDGEPCGSIAEIALRCAEELGRGGGTPTPRSLLPSSSAPAAAADGPWICDALAEPAPAPAPAALPELPAGTRAVLYRYREGAGWALAPLDWAESHGPGEQTHKFPLGQFQTEPSAAGGVWMPICTHANHLP